MRSRLLSLAALLPVTIGLAVGSWSTGSPASAEELTPAPVALDLPTKPGAPTIGAVTAGDHSAVVRWTEPSSDGGAPITGYRITASPDGQVVMVAGDVRSTRVRRLLNGRPVTFTVTATNLVGDGAPSAWSSPVTPRGPARLVALRLPARRVSYGGATVSRARLVRPDGTGVARQRVELQRWVRPTSRWRRVAAGTTGTGGRVTLRGRLPVSGTLRLHHPASSIAERRLILGRVVVEKVITARVVTTRTRVGMAVVVRGRVAPVQRVGTRVYLHRRVAGTWRRLATGRVGDAGRYVVRWWPRRTGSYAVRVGVPGDLRRAADTTRGWWHQVNPETAYDVARDILRNERITLATVHVSAGSDRGTARANVVAVANRRRAWTSCYGSAPCRRTSVDRRMLRAVRHMGKRGSITVSEFAGGIHASGSDHYDGRGVDITWVNGRHVGWGTRYGWVVDLCRAYGASQVMAPNNDPWGGHSRHIHCAWD